MYGDSINGQIRYFWDSLPDAPIIADLAGPSQLIAQPANSIDNGLSLRVYGWDANGLRIMDAAGEDGFLVPVAVGSVTPASGVAPIARIERVSKDTSKSYVSLYVLTSGAPGLLLGEYAPDETEPNYRRIRVNRKCARIRIAYRKRSRLLTSLTDVINLRSKPALVNAVKALSIRLEDPQGAQALLNQAVGWLRDEQKQRDATMPPRQPENMSRAETWHDYAGFY